MLKRCLLVVPPTGLYVREDRCQSSVEDFSVEFFRPPHDLMMMAGTLEKANIECRIIDYPVEGGDLDTFRKDFEQFKADMLVITITTPTLAKDMALLHEAKRLNKDVITVAKGAHFLKLAKETLELYPHLDCAIRGENENTIGEIANKNRDDWPSILGLSYNSPEGIIETEDRPWLEDLDELPFPARHLTKNELYTRPDVGRAMAVIETQRGCPARCVYCLVYQVSGNRIRSRSVSSVVEEVEQCVNKFGIRDFLFKADTFTWNKDWCIELCESLIAKNIKIEWICNSRVDTLCEERISVMKKAGCYAIGFGIESVNKEIIEEIRKGKRVTKEITEEAIQLCQKHKVKTYGYFMIGFPSDTEETVAESVEFSRSIGLDFIDFYIAYPFPGTEFEKMAMEKDLFVDREDVSAYSQAAVRSVALNPERIGELRLKAMRGFYTRPKYIVSQLLRVESFTQLKNYIYYGLSLLRKTRS